MCFTDGDQNNVNAKVLEVINEFKHKKISLIMVGVALNEQHCGEYRQLCHGIPDSLFISDIEDKDEMQIAFQQLARIKLAKDENKICLNYEEI